MKIYMRAYPLRREFIWLFMNFVLRSTKPYIVTPEDTLVIEGDATQLNCTFVMTPNVKGWYIGETLDTLLALDDKIQHNIVAGDYEITGDGNVYNLRIYNATKNEETLYDCDDVAKRRRVAIAHLYVIEHLPLCGVSPGYQVTTYEEVTFTCQIELTDGAPGELVWLKNGEEICRAENHTNILITTLDESAHNAIFDCQLQHKTLPRTKWSKTSCESKLVMDVQYPPNSVIDIKTSNPIIEGGDFQALCRSYGGNPPTVVASYWIGPNGSKVSEEDPLVFENVTRYHSGEYTCIKFNEFYNGKLGNGTAVVYLDVQYLPKVIISVAPVPNVTEGTEVEVRCSSVTGNPEVSMVTLSFEGEIIVGEDLPDLLHTISIISASHAGIYKCIATTIFYDGSLQSSTDEQKIIVYYSPRIAVVGDRFEANIGDVISILCNVNGFPPPKVLWYGVTNDIIPGNEQNRKIVVEWESEEQLTSTLIITVADESYYGIYTCEASNDVKSGVRITTKIVTPESNTAIIASVSTVVVVITLSLIGSLFVFWYRKCYKKNMSNAKGNSEIRLHPKGTLQERDTEPHAECTSFEISGESSRRSERDTLTYEVGHFAARDHGRGRDENKVQTDIPGKYYEVPVNKERKDDDQHYTSLSPQRKDERIYQHLWKTEHLEVSREFLSFRDELHEGAFCRVVKAEAWNIAGKDGTTIVAIKTPKASADPAIRKMFRKELDLLKSIGSHQHVITLLGFCVESEPHYIILEYMGLGNLQNYLRESRSVKDDTLKVDSKRAKKGSDLLLHLREIVSGMKFISYQCVHRDLSACNVLINEQKVCKISGFGLASKVVNENQYKRIMKGRLPIRWMALETMNVSAFTTKSDVWSFGILAWEIVTMGGKPYSGMSTEEVISSVREGYRMLKPPQCSEELYTIMLSCWNAEPKKRPDFTELVAKLHKLVGDGKIHIDVDAVGQMDIHALQSRGGETC